jgi:ammonia channel protein AmtB
MNTLIYSVPAHWIFADSGWLKRLGAIDFAGAGTKTQ